MTPRKPTEWRATIGCPRGHRVRFVVGVTPSTISRVQCECGWSARFPANVPYGEGITTHARHCDLVRMGAWPDAFTGESIELAGDVCPQCKGRVLDRRVDPCTCDDLAGPERFDNAPHPSDGEP